jgi:hypothetical protein
MYRVCTAVREPAGRRIAPGDPDREEFPMRNGSHRFWLCIAAAVAITVIAVPAASAYIGKYNTVKTDSRVTLAVEGANCEPPTNGAPGRRGTAESSPAGTPARATAR